MYEKIASDLKTFVQNQSEPAGERCSIFPSFLANVKHFQGLQILFFYFCSIFY